MPTIGGSTPNTKRRTDPRSTDIPTIIDSLVLSIGLDPRDFVGGSKKVDESVAKTRDMVVKSGNDVESATRKATGEIAKMAINTAALFGVFTSARGLKDFIADIQQTDASLGRLSANMRSTPQAISGWESALRRNGGAAGAAAASFSHLSDQIQQLKIEGNAAITTPLYRLGGLTGQQFDFKKSIDEQMLDISAAVEKLAQRDRPLANRLAKEIGGSQDMANLLLRGPKAIRQMLDEYRKSAPQQADIKSAQDLQDSWAKLQDRAESLGRTLSTALSPAMMELNADLQTWLDKNQDWIKSDLVSSVRDLVDIIKGLGAALRYVGEEGDKVLKTLSELDPHPGKKARGFFDWMVGDTAPQTDEQKKQGLPPTPGQAWNKYMPAWAQIGGKKDTDVTVGGQPVSKANPLPVAPATGQGESGGFWSSLVSGAQRLFGSSGASANTGTPGVPSGGSLLGGRADGKTNPGEGKWWTAERKTHAIERLMKEANLSEHGARGLVARWASVEARGGPTSENNIGGGHYGIAQWSRSRGKSVWGNPDFDAQIGLAVQELNTTEKAAAAALRKAGSDAEGARGASMYERAEGYNPSTGIDNFTGATRQAMSITRRRGGAGRVYEHLPGSVLSDPNKPAGAGYGHVPSFMKMQPAPSVNMDYSRVNTSDSRSVNIKELNVHNARDPESFAKGLKPALENYTFARQAQYGPS